MMKKPRSAWINRNMQVCLVLAIAMACTVSWRGAAPLHAQTSGQGLDATGQLIVDTIKKMCKQDHPGNQQKFRECAIDRYDAMKSFFTKLFHQRDTKGISSDEFNSGITCLEKASPSVRESGRKFAIERADWITANSCYESALR